MLPIRQEHIVVFRLRFALALRVCRVSLLCLLWNAVLSAFIHMRWLCLGYSRIVVFSMFLVLMSTTVSRMILGRASRHSGIIGMWSDGVSVNPFVVCLACRPPCSRGQHDDVATKCRQSWVGTRWHGTAGTTYSVSCLNTVAALLTMNPG